MKTCTCKIYKDMGTCIHTMSDGEDTGGDYIGGTDDPICFAVFTKAAKIIREGAEKYKI